MQDKEKLYIIAKCADFGADDRRRDGKDRKIISFWSVRRKVGLMCQW